MITDIKALAQRAIDGDSDALQIFATLKEIEDQVKQCKDSILHLALEEFRKHGQRTINKFGYEISECASGRYDYKDIPQWVDIKEKLTLIEEKAKMAFKSNNEIDGIQPAIYCANKPSLTLKPLK